MEEPLKFRKGDRIKIEGELYQILGGIELVNRSDGARWTEYYVQNLQNGKLRWLSVDEIYDEYAIYTSCLLYTSVGLIVYCTFSYQH